MSRDDQSLTPTLTDQGVSTAPSPSAADEIAELRQEIARLRAQLGGGASSAPCDAWPLTITYGDQPYSGARLSGISRQRERVRPSTDFPELPRPTRDATQLEADFVRWGYCLVADAMSPGQICAQTERLLDQAAAERAARVARMNHHGHAQLVFNLLPKGQVFRDLAALEPSAADGAGLVE